jgi:hypothetical protein
MFASLGLPGWPELPGRLSRAPFCDIAYSHSDGGNPDIEPTERQG